MDIKEVTCDQHLIKSFSLLLKKIAPKVFITQGISPAGILDTYKLPTNSMSSYPPWLNNTKETLSKYSCNLIEKWAKRPYNLTITHSLKMIYNNMIESVVLLFFKKKCLRRLQS